MTESLIIRGEIIVDTEDIEGARGYEYRGKEGEERDYLDGKYIVRVFMKSPCIDIVCDSINEAQTTYKGIIKSMRVVDINEMRQGR